MRQITSALLTISLLAGATSPALAGPHDKSGGGQAASSSAQSAPAPRADAHAQRAVQPAPQRMAPQPRFVPQAQPRIVPQAQPRVERQFTPQAAPIRAERAQRFNVAPQQRIERAAPQQRFERSAPQQRMERAAPQQRFERSAPQQRMLRAAPQQRFERSAPQQRFERSAPQQRFERAAPQEQFERANPQQRFERFGEQQGRFERAAPRQQQFEEIAPRVERNEGNVPTFSEPNRVRNENVNIAPFAQIVRPREENDEGQDVEASVPVVAYQPTVVTGEVVNVDNDDVFLQTPSGQVEEIVMEGWHGRHHGWGHHVMAIPVIETNGIFYAQPAFVQSMGVNLIDPNAIYTNAIVPTDISQIIDPNAIYPAYNYSPFTPAYGSPYGLSSGNLVSNLLTATLASYVVSYLMGSHPSLSSIASSVLPAVAASALGGGSPYGYPYGYAPSYSNIAAYAPASVMPAFASNYVAPAAYNPVTGYSYPTTCVYTDPVTGLTSYDPACAPATTTSYYASPNVFVPEQLQGVVVGTSGSTLMVLGANGLTPILVNDAPALQSGNVLNGQPATGRVITAYGFYSGSTFVATALQ